MMRRSARFVLTALVLLATARAALAQQATITGAVTDETKAVLPGATVTATNLATGDQSVGVSDERGEYRLLTLPPGQVQSAGRAVRLLDRGRAVDRAARRPERDDAVRAERRAGERDGDGVGEVAARRHRLVAGRGQRRSAGRWRNCRSRAATGWSCRSW